MESYCIDIFILGEWTTLEMLAGTTVATKMLFHWAQRSFCIFVNILLLFENSIVLLDPCPPVVRPTESYEFVSVREIRGLYGIVSDRAQFLGKLILEKMSISDPKNVFWLFQKKMNTFGWKQH